MKKIYYRQIIIKKRAGLAMLKSEKINFESKKVYKRQKGLYIVVNGSKQDNTRIINIYSPNNSLSKYMKQKQMKLKG